MNLEALRLFIRVAEVGSLTQAANQLGVSKATVSVRLKELEAELACQLLQRTTRKVRITEEGEALLPRARRLVLQADEIGAMFHNASTLRGRVRVDLPVNIACRQVLPQLPELLERYPQLDIDLSATDRLVDPIKEGIDIVLRVGMRGDGNIVRRKLGSLRMLNCASPAYLRRHGIPRSIADLQRHFVVNYTSTMEFTQPSFEYHKDGITTELPVRCLVTVSSSEAYTAAALAGLGIIQAPNSGMLEHLATGKLQEVLPEYTCAPMPVLLLHTHGRRVPRRIRVVLDWLTTVLSPFLQSAAR